MERGWHLTFYTGEKDVYGSEIFTSGSGDTPELALVNLLEKRDATVSWLNERLATFSQTIDMLRDLK